MGTHQAGRHGGDFVFVHLDGGGLEAHLEGQAHELADGAVGRRGAAFATAVGQEREQRQAIAGGRKTATGHEPGEAGGFVAGFGKAPEALAEVLQQAQVFLLGLLAARGLFRGRQRRVGFDLAGLFGQGEFGPVEEFVAAGQQGELGRRGEGARGQFDQLAGIQPAPAASVWSRISLVSGKPPSLAPPWLRKPKTRAGPT